MKPDQIETLKQDLVEITCKYEFGGKSEVSKRMWRPSKFKISDTVADMFKGNTKFIKN
jgi:septum formation topological specificity factor MinE